MRRKELLGLKRINATPKMIRMAQTNMLYAPEEHGEAWEKRTFTTRYDMLMRCQTRGRYLMVCLFFPEDIAQGKTDPMYEIYLNPEGNEFETRINSKQSVEDKWSTAKLENLGRVYNETLIGEYWAFTKRFIDSRIWINPEGKKTIQQILRTKQDGWRGILEFQERARSEQIRKKEERQKKPWDKDMALVPKELPGFRKWSTHDTCPATFIFYDYDRKGAKEGYCSYCRKMVPIEKPHHNEITKCSSCGREAVFKLNTYRNTADTGYWKTCCIQKIKGGFVVRQFMNHINYRGCTKENPEIYHEEYGRTLVFKNETRRYEYRDYKGKETRWCADTYEYSRYAEKDKLYNRNVSALKKTMPYTTIFDWDILPCNTIYYLQMEKEYPFLEQLVRNGMFRMAEDFLNYYNMSEYADMTKTNLTGMLKIDKARLKRAKTMDFGMTGLNWLRWEKTANTIWPDEMLKDFDREGIGTSMFGFLPTPIHIRKIWNYLKKQSKLSEESLYQTATTWRDYYNMAEQENWNVDAPQIGWPKNLEDAHMKAILAHKGESIKEQTKKLEEKWPKVNDILPETKKFEYKHGKYQIIAATCIEDMVREGTALSHCMDHADFYYDRIQKFEAYPFFLRKTSCSDKPWYTLEVESSGNIRQKRTTGDNQNPDLDEAIPFLQEWQKVFRSRMTPEEIEHGILANEQRIKEYEELRKNGNKIWHGKLAGKLLADVLEADFMAAV